MADTLTAPALVAGFGSPEASRRAFWSTSDLKGEHYRNILQRFHRSFKPATYLEIGVLDGATLEFATCASIAVDPKFRLEKPIVHNKPTCFFYNMTSDAFFESHSPSATFGKPLDMAFLDGMHWFEFLLRDFINVERHCKHNSILFLHDCLPTDEYIARRDPDDTRDKDLSRHPGWWAGDVWKVTAILRKYRPDLKILAFDAGPTGLVAITGLDPASDILSKAYFDLVAEYRGQNLAEHGDAYLKSLNIVGTQQNTSFDALSASFWL